MALAGACRPAWAGVGADTAPFLLIPPDARAAAMGGCGAAGSEGAAGLNYNPASLAEGSRADLGATRLDWIEGSQLTSLGLALPAGPGRPGLGFSLVSFGSGPIPLTLETPDGNFDPSSSGTFSTDETALRLGAGCPLPLGAGRRLDLGASLLVLRQDLAGQTQGGAGADLGLRYQDPLGYIRAGAALQNLGPGVNGDGLPGLARAGIQVLADALSKKDLALDADLLWPLGQAPRGAWAPSFPCAAWSRPGLAGP